MGNKKLLLTVGALCIIALLVSVVDYYQKKPAAGDTRIAQQLVDGKIFGDVIRVELKRSTGGSITLVRDDNGGWTIDNEEHFPVAGSNVVRLFDDLAKAKIVRSINNAKDGFADMELTKGDKITLRGKDKVLSELLLGKRHKGGEGQFIAFTGEDKAYLIDLSINYDTSPAGWELKTLTNVNHDNVKSIGFINQGTTTSLTRDKAQEPMKLATPAAGEKPDTAATAGIDDLLAGLNYNTKLKQSSQAPQLWQNARATTVTTFDGNEYSIKLAELKVPKLVQPEPVDPAKGTKPKGAAGPAKPKAPAFETKYYVIIDGKGPAPDMTLLHELAKTWAFEINEMQAKKLWKERAAFVTKS